MRIVEIDEARLATTGDEYLALIASDSDWFARNEDDLRQLRAYGSGPLAKITQAEFDEFVGSLLYGGGGVASGSYKPLIASLTITEIFEVFARFGMSPTYTLRILEAKCELKSGMGHADCTFEFWSFCASNCDVVVFPPLT